jgi:hypothetical protein
MPNVVILGHGGRGAGTATGTYVVPPNVTVYFFEDDTHLLNTDGILEILPFLLTRHPNELVAQAAAAEVKRAFESVPNYVVEGNLDLPYDSGVYVVGQPPEAGPALTVHPGTQKHLSDLIGGQSQGGAIGNSVYWLCCRAAPTNSNNPTVNVVRQLVDGSGNVHVLGGEEVGQDMGRKPSAVSATGRWR